MHSSFNIVKMLNNSYASEFFGKDSNMKHLTITNNNFPRVGMEIKCKGCNDLEHVGNDTYHGKLKT